jgi:hypothetical protein
MPVARSRVLPEFAAGEALSAAYGWWAPALASMSPPGLDKAMFGAPAFGGMAEQAHDATLAAVRHWRALTELQITAANEAYRLAAAHAESRQAALAQWMDTLWPAVAKPKPEAAHV